MLRCPSVRIPIALFALALAVRAVVFGLHPDAAYPDSYYYVDVAADQALDAVGAPATDLLLSADPGGFKYFTGRGGVVTPNDSLEVIRQVAADYDIRWLVLERAHLVEPMSPVIESKARLPWIGAPIFTLPYNGPKTGDAAADSAPAMAIYPVCTRLDDVRCGSTP